MAYYLISAVEILVQTALVLMASFKLPRRVEYRLPPCADELADIYESITLHERFASFVDRLISAVE